MRIKDAHFLAKPINLKRGAMMGFARKIAFEDAIFLALPILRGARLTQRLCDPAP